MQLSEDIITLTMEKRNLSRKSAVQWLRRQTKTAPTTAVEAVTDVAAVPVSSAIVEQAVAEMLPVQRSQHEQPLSLERATAIAATFAPDATTTPAPAVTTNGITFDATKCVEMFKANAKIVDIAVAMGYPRGSGQNRVRAALAKAGLN